MGAVVAPEGALGGDAILSCLQREVPIITVPNTSLLSVSSTFFRSNQNFNRENGIKMINAKSFAEAAGLLLAIREGISLDSLQRPLSNVSQLK